MAGLKLWMVSEGDKEVNKQGLEDVWGESLETRTKVMFVSVLRMALGAEFRHFVALEEAFFVVSYLKFA